MRTQWPWLFLHLLVGTAAWSENSVQPYCAKSSVEVPLDDRSYLGFSGHDLLDLSVTHTRLPWVWDYRESDNTFLTMRVTSVARTAHYIHSVPVYPEGGSDQSIICADHLEVDAWIDLYTPDGRFHERWHTVLFDTDGTDCMLETSDLCPPPGTEARFTYEFQPSELNGNFYGDVPIPEGQITNFTVEGQFRREGIFVNVYGNAIQCTNDICYWELLPGGHSIEDKP